MVDYRAQFDPQGRMNWGTEPTEFPSAWWWDTSQFPSITLKVHSDFPRGQYITIGSVNVNDPSAGFVLASAGGAGSAAPAVSYLGGAVWQHDDGQGVQTTLDLNTAVADLTTPGIAALKAALTYAASDISAITPSGFTGSTVQSLIDELAARHALPVTNAAAGVYSLNAERAQVLAFDTSAAAITVQLPSAPVAGDIIKFYAVGGLDSLQVGATMPNPLTIEAGGTVALDGLLPTEQLDEMVNHFHLAFAASPPRWELGL